MILLLASFLLSISSIQTEQNAPLDKWIQKIVRDMIDMNDLGKYSDKAIPADVTVDFLMVDSVKDIQYDDKQITMLIDHGKGVFCTELKFNYIIRDGKYYLVFSPAHTIKIFGKDKKSIDPWVEKNSKCD